MELIRIITTGEQGSPVVSARELHSFLEVKSKFADWFKNRISQYGFTEGQDFVTLSKNLENGGRELDYGLTLDTAKELSMVERNAKGKQARQYFITAEKQLNQQHKEEPSTVDRLLADHERRIAMLEKQVATLLAIPRPQPELEASPQQEPSSSSLRTKVTKLVNHYATTHSIAHYMVWNVVYSRLQSLYGFNVRSKRKYEGESWIDVAERHNQLDRIYAIVSAELNFSED